MNFAKDEEYPGNNGTISDKNHVRNFGVIAHVDHGKTTMSDSLLAAAGMISPSVAGQALAPDSMPLEQSRQMTIKVRT